MLGLKRMQHACNLNCRYFIMDLLSSAVIEKLSEAYLDSQKAKIGAAVWDAASETLMTAIPPSIAPPPPANGPDARPKRAASNKRNADVLYTELKSGIMDPHGLVEPFKYGDPCGVAPHGQQPYRVIVHPQAMALCDIHCNICSDEVIGILAGRWDAERRIIFIQAAFPCAAQILDDGGATDVELDATAQVIAQDSLERVGLRMVGWYHSHPKFLPDPSVIDLANHHSHQAMFKETDSSIEPFVGLIVSTMEKDNPSKLSLQRWFNVHPYEGRLCSSGCGSVVMPLAVEIDIANVHINLEQSVQVEHPRVKEVLQREVTAAEVQHASGADPVAANGNTEKKKRPMESEPDGIESVGESSAEGQRKKRSTEPPKPPPIPPPPPPLAAPSSSADSGSRRPIRRTASKLDEAIKDLLSTSTDGKLKAVKPSASNNRREQPPPTKPSSRQMGKKESKPKHEVVVQSKSPREPVDPLFRSLLVSIGHPGLQSSALARQLIHSCCAELLCLTVNVVSLGFYYSRYARRVDLLSPWQGQLKIHKLRQCAHRWLCHFHCDRPPGSSDMDSYLDLVCRFLQSCWEEFTKSGKLKLKK